MRQAARLQTRTQPGTPLVQLVGTVEIIQQSVVESNVSICSIRDREEALYQWFMPGAYGHKWEYQFRISLETD